MSRNKLIAEIPADDWATLRPHMKELTVDKGSVLADAVYFPSTAVLSLLAVFPDGRAIDTRTIGYEGAAGILAALTGTPASSKLVVTLPGLLVAIDATSLRTVAEASLRFRDVLLRYCRFVEIQAEINLGCVSYHSASQRLAKWLLTTADRTDANRFAITQADLAAMVGVQRTTVNAAASELQRSGAIRYSRGQLTVASRPALEASTCGCYMEERHRLFPLLEQDAEVA